MTAEPRHLGTTTALAIGLVFGDHAKAPLLILGVLLNRVRSRAELNRVEGKRGEGAHHRRLHQLCLVDREHGRAGSSNAVTEESQHEVDRVGNFGVTGSGARNVGVDIEIPGPV